MDPAREPGLCIINKILKTFLFSCCLNNEADSSDENPCCFKNEKASEVRK